MFDVSTLSTLILGGGGLITGILALFSARSSKDKVNSETSVNMSNAEASREKLYQSRETFWRDEVGSVKDSFAIEIENLKTEIAWLRALIELHVPWDWEVIRLLKLGGIDYRDPPTLNYIKSKYIPPEDR